MSMQTLVTTMSDMPHGRRWMINPEANRVYVAGELTVGEQWEAVAEAVEELRSEAA